MKNKSFKLKFLFTSILCFLVIVGCQKSEEEIVEIDSSPRGNFSISKLESSDISKNLLLTNLVLDHNSKVQNKESKNDGDNFIIDGSNATYMEIGNNHSYTFGVIPSEPIQGFQNVVYVSVNDGSYAEYLYTYELNDDELDRYQNGDNSVLEGNIKKKFISIKNQVPSSSKRIDECFLVGYKDRNTNGGSLYETKGQCEQNAGDGECEYYSIQVSCPESITDSPGSNGGGSSGSGSNVTNYYLLLANVNYSGNTGTGFADTGGNLGGSGGGSPLGFTSPVPLTVPYHLTMALDLSLSSPLATWLANNHEESLELIQLLNAENQSEEAKIITRITIDALRLGQLDGPFSTEFISSINNHSADVLTDPRAALVYALQVTRQCAILKVLHPEWSNSKIFWVATKEAVQLILDLGGLVPVVGEICDIANGIIYTIDGDGINATLSFSAAIPFAGWFSTGTKMAYKVSNIASKKVLKWVVRTDGIIEFGRSGQLRKVMGNLIQEGHHAHHIIPWAKSENPLVQLAAKAGDAFHLNDEINGLSVAAWRNTNHPTYSNNVAELMTNAYNPNMTANEARIALRQISNHVVSVINSNPNTKLNLLSF